MKKKLEIVSSVNSLNEKKWNLKFENANPFLHTNFLRIFEKFKSVNSVTPVYITTKNGNVYGHLIKIDGSKIANYLTNNSRVRFKKIFLKKIKFQFFCFGNTYLSNIPSCDFENEGVSEEELDTIFSTLKKKYKVKFDLLSDTDKKVLKKYKVWRKKKFMGREFTGVIRSTFLIDKKGRILKIWDNVKVKDHAKEVLKTLKIIIRN